VSKSHQIYTCRTGKNNSRIQQPQTEIKQNHRCYLVPLLHLVGILLPHINDDARSKSHKIEMYHSLHTSDINPTSNNKKENTYIWFSILWWGANGPMGAEYECSSGTSTNHV